MKNACVNNPGIALSIVLLIVLTVVSYSDIQHHEFLHWDDIEYVVNNELLQPFSFENVVSMFTTFDSANWHPITWLSYALNLAISGDSAAAFKWTNVALHLVNCLLVFWLAITLIAKSKQPTDPIPALPILTKHSEYFFPAYIAALLFAVHPQHVESVAWISDRKDLLCTAFYLMATIAYLYSYNDKQRSYWNNLVVVLFLLALMSKSIAVTFPVLIMLLDIYPLKKVGFNQSITRNFKILFGNKLTLLFLAAVVSTITLITQSGQIGTVEKADFVVVFINASFNYVYYFLSIFAAGVVAPYHSFPDFAINPSLWSIAPVMGIFIIYTGLWKLNRIGVSYPLYAFIAYTIMILPAVGLIHVGHAARADRYAYLPSTVFYILIGVVLFSIFKNIATTIPRRLLFVFSFLAVSLHLSLETYNYTKDWRNDAVVWQKVLDLYPDSSVTANLNLGNYYFKKKDYLEAIKYYNRTTEIDPSRYGAYENLGVAYEKLGDHELAEKYYKKMIEVKPKSARPYNVVGDYYYKRNNYPKADYYYRQAMKLAPSYPNTLLRNGMMDYIKGDFSSASEKIDYALMLDPHNIGALQIKVKILLDQKQFEKARQVANTLLELRPKDKIALDAVRRTSKISGQPRQYE